jgi:hypothetical protein
MLRNNTIRTLVTFSGGLALLASCGVDMPTGAPGKLIDPADDLETEDPHDVVVHSIAPDGVASSGEALIAAALTGAPQAIFLNREGRTYQAGRDDSGRGVSSVVASTGIRSATIPPLAWGEDKWRRFVECVRDEFARFDIVVTDQRPATGPYIETAVGGRASALGMSPNVGGVAPVDTYNCRPIAGAIVFAFADSFPDPIVACEVATQEIAHAVVPLDHEYLASDPMTYLRSNSHKTFQDQDAECGEYSPRRCFCNRARQNSVQLLLQTLGASNGAPPAPPATQPPPTPPAGDTAAPQVAVTSPQNGATLTGNTQLRVTVHATDAVGVAGVSLFWAFNGAVLPCDAQRNCTRSGDDYTWTLNVGTGSRQFYAVATDAAGNRAQSATVQITLASLQPPPSTPQPNQAPVVILDRPSEATTFRPGDVLEVQARVTDPDGGTITQVLALWTLNGRTTMYPMHEVAPGIFYIRTTVSTTATPGPRTIAIRATDDGGLRTTTQITNLTIQQ